MTPMRYQPQGGFELAQRYADWIVSGWLATQTGFRQLGPKWAEPNQRFSEIAKVITGPDGYTLAANSASESGSASMYIPHIITKNDFTFAGIFRVRSTSGAGVGARSNSDDILLWRQNGRFQIRVSGTTATGPAFPLDTTISYVLTSTAEGVSLFVNGGLIISLGPRGASNTGFGLDVYADYYRGGGAMDMDSPLCFLASGMLKDEARALSANLWQIFEEEDEPDFAIAAGAPMLGIERLALGLTEGPVGMRISRCLPANPAKAILSSGDVGMRATRRFSVVANSFHVATGGIQAHATRRLAVGNTGLAANSGLTSLRAGRRLAIGAAPAALAGQQVSFAVSSRSGEIDASLVPPSRTARFGGGKRVVIFSGGLRVVTFNGGKRIVRF